MTAVVFYLIGVSIALVHAVPALRPLYAYRGRHRNGHRHTPAEHWAAAYETRIGAELGRYLHNGGTGRYVHLRPAELDAKAERDQALADLGLMLRSPWSTPVEPDEWTDELVGSAT